MIFLPLPKLLVLAHRQVITNRFANPLLMKYLAWSGPPIPANATVTGTYRLSNGTYALYYPGGQLRFLCRVVSAQVKSWLNLAQDGQSGHWDRGNTGEAYYADGRMETFSPWDDSMPFPATMPFSQWLAGAMADLNQPVPANAPQPAALDLRALRASCRVNFQGRPEDSDADTLRIRLLGLLRRLSAAMADFTDSPDRLHEVLLDKARMSPQWAEMLTEQLPLVGRGWSFFWRPCWSGIFEWQRQEATWLMQNVADFDQPLAELNLFKYLAVGPISTVRPGPANCPLRLLVFACQLWSLLHPGPDPLALAKALQPAAQFCADMAPWKSHPEELLVWTRNWQDSRPDPALLGRRALVDESVDYWNGRRPTFPNWQVG